MRSVHILNWRFSFLDFVLLTLTMAFRSSEFQFITWKMGMIVIVVHSTSRGLGKARGMWKFSMNKESSINLSCY